MRHLPWVFTAAIVMVVLMALPTSAQQSSPVNPQYGKQVGGCHEGGTGSGDFNIACGGTVVGSQSGGGGAGHYGNPTGFSGGGGSGGKDVEDPGGYGQHCTVNDAGEWVVVGSRDVC